MTKNYNYNNAVLEDVKNYLNNEINLEDEIILEDKYNDIDDIRTGLYDDLWIDDSVTGNASGSYTFNREEAKENVLADMDTVIEALKEFCIEAETIAEKFLAEDWEYFDVTARCYVLGAAIDEALEEREEEIKGYFEKKENDVW